ncbi:MAG TPA: glycosyltransferase family 1 protein [Chryseolinea sp.]|nr:glycosyltransferase family 1 protein [Chryseolinea sp.]
MKVGFDAKRFFNNFTGLGNYSRFIIDALSKHATENEYFLYSPKVKTHPEFNQILQRDNVKTINAPATYTRFNASSLWRTWGISKDPTVQTLNVFHGLSQELPVNLPTTLKKVVTVHDLIFFRYAELYNLLDVFIYKAKVKAACRQADIILATSIQTKNDIVDFLRIDAAKIHVVYQGCHPSFKQHFSHEEISKTKTKYNLPEHYILNVGTIEERKNVLVLVKAVSALPSDLLYPIVIVGRATKYKSRIIEEAQRLGVGEKIIFLHNVSFADLPAIYQGARLFVYPSIFEGFGIPVVEALESSVPVIAASGSCLSEAGGPGSIYVNPTDAAELTEQLEKVLTDSTLCARMIAHGKGYIEQFAPKVISEKLLEVYNA